MGFHLLALAAARGFLQAFFHLHGSAPPPPLLWPLNIWLPLARHLPEACGVLCGALAAHVAWLRRAYARGGTVWSRDSRGRHGGGDDDGENILRQALLNVSY
ncbi:uncharacterized protein LOC100833653 [Brachypodium distachyon]|uniref:Uncharacterized protein n=1 Tax=Brachypodium distachyon TaxID=15368 RepID=A0A0Q3H9W1_BRADI|nr:uncharacterized protein LOC100833653 [Brachypodium distachyon]KQJ84979.1 hypothetical protein BRADI_5g24065v3 [Brachypodium distachyon]|eukprot:XP_010240525.1 uncharacterized protein LOC100833653 [Brachypodium distachyon]